MAPLWCHLGQFESHQSVLSKSRWFDFRAASHRLDDGHSCFINDTLGAVPSMGSLRHLINFFGGALEPYVFKAAFGCGFWCTGFVAQNFFQLTEESQNGS